MIVAYKITNKTMTVYVTGMITHATVCPATAIIPSIRKEEKNVLGYAAQIALKLRQFTAGKITVHALEAEFDDEGLLLCQRLEFTPIDFVAFAAWAKTQKWETKVLFGAAASERSMYRFYHSKNTRWHRIRGSSKGVTWQG